MRDLAGFLRAKAEGIRAEARALLHEPRLSRREVYLVSVAMQKAASCLDDHATAIEDESTPSSDGGGRGRCDECKGNGWTTVWGGKTAACRFCGGDGGAT